MRKPRCLRHSSSASMPCPDARPHPENRRPGGTRIQLGLLAALLLVGVTTLARAQDYTSIVVFGDSLSDTGNVAHLTFAKYGVPIPGPAADYTLGRFTDGPDTLPAARSYFGVWIEQLAATFPAHPVVIDSLDGGTDYAYGYATTGSGTRVLAFGPGNAFSVSVENVGQQISDYLATHPVITSKTLFIVWVGAIDIRYATSPDQVFDAAIQESLDIQRLIAAGATQILVANVPPLGLTPLFNGSPAAAAGATQEAVLYNDVLAFGLDVLSYANARRHVHIYQLDTFSLLNRIVASPSAFSLTNVTGMSQGDIAVNPDTWLFWDSLHPTTRGHNILAVTAEHLLTEQTAPHRR